ncbi:DUF2591 domain-containing protein [Providencia alcalifaciens]|uniref:phage protein NinX family protein n=1 Tax=Providencia TaxID=586 RepID=UPI0012B576F4|nr:MULTISPECIES: phage protein NinX family protein [Providencia]MTC51058.1 DUF2591 domain-containing protein [Providencia alcalifaciens]
MNKYTELSDFEINKKVASHYLPCDYNLNEHTKTVELIGFLGDTDEYNVYGIFDPCNNPADAMPIIIENKIAMNHPYDIWQCGSGWNVAENKNPLRACMESYLLMKDAENNNGN